MSAGGGRALALVWALALANLGYAGTLVALAYVAPDPEAFAGTGPAVPDFTAFWAAGRLALEGAPALAWDWAAHRAAELEGLGHDFRGWLPWHYPPPFQLLLAPLAALPLWPAMALWAGATLALLLWTAARILPGPLAPGAVLAAAPTAMVLVNGQTGAFLAALLGLGLLGLERRPAAAGLPLGLLVIKPQLALGVPVALVAGRRWRALAAAALAALVLCALSAGILGAEAWAAFLASLSETAGVFTGDGPPVAPRHRIGASPYTLLRHLGLGLGPALAVQGAVALAVLGLLARAWARPGPSPALRAALLCFATAAATPRILGYDLHLLLIGGLFQLRHARTAGHFRGEGAILLAALLAAFLSMIRPPGLAWALAPLLFAACWAGHARPLLKAPRQAPRTPGPVPGGESFD